MAGRWRTLGRELRTPIAFVLALGGRFGWHHMPSLAAGLAYFFLLAFFPFLLFLVAMVTLVPRVQGVTEWLLANAAAFVPPEAFVLVDGVIRGVLAEPRGGLVSIGVGLALWSASAGYLGVAECLNVAYGVTERRPWWRTRLEALGITIALSFFVVLAFVLTLFTGPLASFVAGYLGPAGAVATVVINWSLSLSLMTLVTATTYYVAPDVDGLEFEWLSPGVVVFVAGFSVASASFSMWVARFASYDKTYGSLGAPIILLFWLYLLATFFLLGGELNALLDERRATGGDRSADAEPRLESAT
jgi:membrane protein